MHELAVTQSVLEIVLRHAEETDAERITDIHLVIGQLSSYVDDSVAFYWDIISAGTIAEGARLHFRRLPAQIECRACGERYALSGDFLCPACGQADVEIISGDEFYVESIEVETDCKEVAT